MRARGKNLNFNKDVPAKVDDMKEGEWQLNSNGLYGRVGNQILVKNWPAYYGIFDEFDDESIDPAWDVGTTAASASEIAAGYLRTTPTGVPGNNHVVLTKEFADPSNVIPAGTPIGWSARVYIPPSPYTADQTDNGNNVHHYRMFQWSLWDNDIYWTCTLEWAYGGLSPGYDMLNMESAYWIESDISDEYNSQTESFSTAQLAGTVRADTERVVADKNHDGWFEFRFTKSVAGVLKVEWKPDGGSWIDFTPSGLTVYDLDIGGKNSYGWGFDMTIREYNGTSYSGPFQGPLDVDWWRSAQKLKI